MAFENVTTGDFKTYLTKYGMNRLLNNKLNLKYFSLSDDGINYAETVDSSVLVKSVTGEEIKTFYNSSNELRFVSDTTVTSTNNISKKEVVFVDECNGNEYKNITATVYLGNYLQELRDTLSNIDTVSMNYKPYIRLFDFVKIYEYTENAFNEYKLWDTKDANITYTFNSDDDYKNYTIFDNTHVTKNSGRTSISYDQNRFKTPFKLSFSSLRADNGVITQNGAGNIILYPVNEIGYLADGTFYRPENLTQLVYDNSRNIYPTVRFNNIYHNLKPDTTTVYKSPVNREIFRFENLLESGITAAKNMFDFYGVTSPYDHNLKSITINMRVNSSSSDTDTVKAKDANLKLILTLDLDESNWSSLNNKIDINI